LEKVKDTKFAWEVQENYRRFEAMGVGRWDRIQQTRKGQVKERKQTAKANGRKKKKNKKKKKKRKRGRRSRGPGRCKRAARKRNMRKTGIIDAA